MTLDLQNFIFSQKIHTKLKKHKTFYTPELDEIQALNDETREYTSGKPRAQAIPHETTPTMVWAVLAVTSGPPESPMQVPAPVRPEKAQILLSTIVPVVPNRERQSALERTVLANHIRFAAADPGC